MNTRCGVGLQKAARDTESLKKDVSALVSANANPEYVLNVGTQVMHWTLCGKITDPSDTWRTVCGFRFGMLAHVRSATPSSSARQCRSCSHLAAPSHEDDITSSADS